MSPLLIDIGRLSACCTDSALESIYKSLSDPAGDEGVFAPHHDPYVRAHIEDVTQRGQAILLAIQNELLAVMGGEPMSRLLKADAPWLRWSEDKFEEIRVHLEQKHARYYTPADWSLLVDWLVQKYLPDGVIHGEAQYLAVRAYLAGRMQAALDPMPPPDVIARVMEAMPLTVVAANQVATFTGREAAIIGFARARAAELIGDLGDATRHRIKSLIIDHEEQRAMGEPKATVARLQSRMRDEFAILNRDWRRVAITEVARNANEGFILAMPVGAKVRRMEAYTTACPFCRKIHGMVFEVVSPEREDKDGWAHVWPGKTNVGRSSSPRKRDGDKLVERSEEELWWPATGVQHPQCRGTFVRVSDIRPGIDPKFKAWLAQHLAQP